MKLLLLLLVLLCLAASPITTKLQVKSKVLTVQPMTPTIDPSVTVSWDDIGDTNLVYYTVYQGGQPRQYTNAVRTTSTSFTATNLQTGGYYFFTVTATVRVADGNSLESPQGAETSWFLTYQPTGNRLVSLTQQWSPTGADPWQTLGPAMLFTNPMYPVMFFRQQIAVTNQ